MTHMLNYADQLIVDMNTNSDRAVLIEPLRAFTQYAWYLSQYEIAYDGNLHDLTWDQFQLGWSFNFVRPLELTLNNKPAGNKMLFLQSPGFNFTFFPWGQPLASTCRHT